MNESRHAFILTGTDRTKAAFNSVNASVSEMQKTVVTATSLIGTALGGVGLVAFTSQMGKAGEEALLVANRLNMTTEQITSLQYAASKFGLEGDAMNGVLQDMSIRIQEFAEIGTGEAADFFENLNLDVKDFINLRPDELLLKVAKELENVGDASSRVYLDQLGGDDLVSLLPALRNSAEGLKALRQEAFDTNKVLSQTDAIRLASIANEVNTLESSAKSLSLQLAAEFEPTVKAISNTFKRFAEDEDAVTDGLNIIGVSAVTVSGIYLGRLVGAFAASTQAKYADIVATRQKLAADLESAQVELAAANQKLTTEKAAYNQSLASKRADVIASELESKANLERRQTAVQAAAAEVEDALALKANAEAIEHNALRKTRLKAAEDALTVSREKQKVTTDRLATSEQRHSALVVKNAASIEVLANTTRKVDKATSQAATKTKKLEKAQAAFNATAKTGTVVSRGLAGGMALLGGPIGLLTLAATTLGAYAMTAGESESDFNAAAVSVDELQTSLKKAPSNELSVMLQQLQKEAMATEAAMESINSTEYTGTANAGREKGFERRKTRKLEEESAKRNVLLEKELLVQAAIDKRSADEAKKQAIIKDAIISESLKKQIDLISDYGKSEADLRQEAYQKEQADINDMANRKLISQSQLRSMLHASESKYNLEMEQLRNQQRSTTLTQFGDDYSRREKMGLEHQKRMLDYIKNTGVTDEKDERLAAYWDRSYQYGLTSLRKYQDGVMKEYRDYGKSAVQVERERYSKEQDELKKHLKRKDITQAQYDEASQVAAQRNSDSLKKIKQAELDSKITAQRDFANIFVGMADSENSKLAAIGKAAAIYNIGLSTYQGAIAAYAALAPIPIVGPGLGVAAGVALAAYGAEQVANVNNQSYHTGGIAGLPSDTYGQKLKAGEMNATLMINEEVLTADDPRHRKNLKLSNGNALGSSNGAISVVIGDVIVNVEKTNASANDIATVTADEVASTVMNVLYSRKGQKAVYSGVGAEAGRNAGKIKGVRS